jgi:hypothetical protein
MQVKKEDKQKIGQIMERIERNTGQREIDEGNERKEGKDIKGKEK